MADVNRTNLRSQNATLSIEVSLKSQIVTSSHGGAHKLPYAFTENGIAMPLSPPQHPHTVLRFIYASLTHCSYSLLFCCATKMPKD